MERVLVVDRDLFARPDVAQSEKQNVTAGGSHEGIRRARVIDVVGAVSAATAVQTPAVIEPTDAQHLAVRAPLRLGVGDQFSGVFRDLAAALEIRGGKTATT